MHKIWKSASNIAIFGENTFFHKSFFAVYSKHPYIFLFFIYCWFYVKKWPFLRFFMFFCLFFPRWGVEKIFFEKKWLKYILTTFLYIENITKNHKTVFGRNYRGFLHISGTRFISVFLCFCENPENGPNNMVGGFCVRGRSYQNPFESWPFRSYRTQIKQNWRVTNFFPPCSNIAPTITPLKKIKKFLGTFCMFYFFE